MASDDNSKTINRSRFAVLSPSGVLTISIAVLSSMPIAYLIAPEFSIIVGWIFFICQIVLIFQGLNLLVLCGLKTRQGDMRLFGIYLFLYGTATVVMTFWFVAIVTFGGPARDEVPLFLAKLWAVAAAVCIPTGLYLRRRGHVLLKKPTSNAAPTTRT